MPWLSIGIILAVLTGGGDNWSGALLLGIYGLTSGILFVFLILLHSRFEVLSPWLGALYGAAVGALTLPFILLAGSFSLILVGADAILGYFVCAVSLSFINRFL